MPFKKGQKSPGGRPPGSLNKSTLEIKEILDQNVDFEDLVIKLAKMAMRGAGNVRAIKLLLAYRFGNPRDTVDMNLKGSVERKVANMTKEEKVDRFAVLSEKARDHLKKLKKSK